ncbi:MAG: hypothetical protein Q8P90_05480 [bacterium]|nr:hypothetical protein [bacterium]
MSKRKQKGTIFGIFVIVAGLIVIIAVTVVSQKSTDFKQEENYLDSNNSNDEEFVTDDSDTEVDSVDTNINNEADSETDDSDSLDKAENQDETLAEDVSDITATGGAGIDLTEFNLEVLVPATTAKYDEITTYTFEPENTLSVMPSSYEGISLNETDVLDRETISVGNQVAERLTIASAKDGSEISVVQVISDDYLYDFRGSDDFLESLDQYIKISN